MNRKWQIIICIALLTSFALVDIWYSKSVKGKEEELLIRSDDYTPIYDSKKNKGSESIKNIYKISNNGVLEELNLYSELDVDIAKELIKGLKSIEKDNDMNKPYVYRLINEPITYNEWIILSLGKFENTRSLEEDISVLGVIDSKSVIVRRNESTLSVDIEGTDKFYDQLTLLPNKVIKNEAKELLIKYRK